MLIKLRTDRLPIIDVEFPDHFEDQEYRQLFERYIELSATHPRVAYLHDLRKLDPLRAPAKRRRLAAEVFRTNVTRFRNLPVCEARLVSSELTRGVLTAFDWLTGTRWPCATFTSIPDAERWLDQHLRGNLSVA